MDPRAVSPIQSDLWWALGFLAFTALGIACWWMDLEMPGHNMDDEEGGE